MIAFIHRSSRRSFEERMAHLALSGTRSRRVAPARPRCLCARSFWRKVATGEDLHHRVSEMDLNPVAIELYLMEPPLPTRYTINGGRQRGLNKPRVERF